MTRPVFHFQGFELNPALRELRRDGVAVPLSPMLFDALVWLLTHRDRAIGRDELMAAVWGKADVTDAQLAQLVRKLRRTLGDDGGAQGMILTVPRFGYRWNADTVECERAAEASPDAAPLDAVAAPAETAPRPAADGDPATPAGAPRWRRVRWFHVLPVVAATGLMLLFAAYRHAGPGAMMPAAESEAARSATALVAVLPAELGADAGADWSWLRVGLMDLLAHRLRQGGLAVTPSDNVVAAWRDEGDAEPERHLREATGAYGVLALQVRRTSRGWAVAGRWQAPDAPVREFEAHARDPTRAARQLADRILAWSGRAPLGGDDADGEPDAWLQRIDAALLDSDFDGADALLREAPRALLGSPLLSLREGELLAATDRIDAAGRAYQAALDALPPGQGDGAARAEALVGAGGVLAQQGQLEQAIAVIGEAVTLLQGRDAPGLLGEALYGRAVLEMALGRLDEAESDFSQARVEFELGSDSLRLARLDAQQSTLLALRQRDAEALVLLQRATVRFERFAASGLLVDALGSTAIEHMALLQPAAAQAAVERAGAWLPGLRQPITLAIHRYTAIRVLAANGRLREASVQLDHALDGADEVPVAGYGAALRVEGALLELARGESARAAEQLRQAMPGVLDPRLDSVLYGRLRGTAWLAYVRALASSGQVEEARVESARFAAAAGQDPVMSLLSTLAEAEQRRQDRQPDEAIRLYEMALREAGLRGAPVDLAAIGVSYADMLLDLGELARATTVVGQLSRWADSDFQCARIQARLYHALGQPEAAARAAERAATLAGERQADIPWED